MITLFGKTELVSLLFHCFVKHVLSVIVLLAPLSRRMSYCDYAQSVACPPTLLDDFSSKTLGLIFFKIYAEPSAKGGLKLHKLLRFVE